MHRLMVCVVLLGILVAGKTFAESSVTADVIYGHKDGMALTYDVFSPDQGNGGAVVYMVSGGWFSIWRKPEERITQFAFLLESGFTVFAVHHGSAPRYKVPEAVSDVRAALRHIIHQAETYGIDSKRIGVWGGSAGGHLSLMLGLNSEGRYHEEREGSDRRRLAPQYLLPATAEAQVAAVVAYYPPVDLRELSGPNDRYPALDFPDEQAPGISPILFVDKSDPPVMMIHGDKDRVVEISHSFRLENALSEAAVTNELVLVEGAGHGFRGSDRKKAESSVVAWFSQHLLKK